MIKLGITGYPLSYTRSPRLHRRFLREAALRGSYEAFPFDPSKGRAEFFRFLDAKRADGFRGLNVTMPLKEWAYEYASRRGGFARGFHGRCASAARAANTLVFRRGRVLAANTDPAGLWDDVASWLGDACDAFDLLVLGTGGAARGALAGIRERHPMASRAASMQIVGRRPSKVRELRRIVPHALKNLHGGAVERVLLVLWCMPPLGRRESAALWRRADLVAEARRCFLYDLNYGERGASTVGLVPRARRRDGASMLERQARASFGLWLRGR